MPGQNQRFDATCPEWMEALRDHFKPIGLEEIMREFNERMHLKSETDMLKAQFAELDTQKERVA